MSAPGSNPTSLDLFALSADERYAYFIREAIARDGVWALQGPGGFVAFRDEDGHDCFPFWPSPESAAALANDDWADCRPEPLALEVFMERWLKGMARDARLASVFPAPDGAGIVVEPLELYEDLGGSSGSSARSSNVPKIAGSDRD